MTAPTEIITMMRVNILCSTYRYCIIYLMYTFNLILLLYKICVLCNICTLHPSQRIAKILMGYWSVVGLKPPEKS